MNINATFFAELLAFCIFVFITYRYIWPSMENLLEDRRKEISDGLEAASQSQRKLEEANKESATILEMIKYGCTLQLVLMKIIPITMNILKKTIRIELGI